MASRTDAGWRHRKRHCASWHSTLTKLTLRNDGAAVAKPELLSRAERRHAHFRKGGRLSERAEQVVPLVEMNKHGAARCRAAVMFISSHVVEEVKRAVVAEGLGDVLRVSPRVARLPCEVTFDVIPASSLCERASESECERG